MREKQGRGNLFSQVVKRLSINMRKQEGLDLYRNAIFRYGVITDPDGQRLNVKLDLQSLFRLLCTAVLIG